MKQELETLENLIGQLDFLLNDGVVVTLEDKARAIELFEKGLELIAEMNYSSNGKLVMPLLENL